MRAYVAGAQLLILVALVALVAWIAYKLFGNGAFAGARWLKEETPLGLPARGIDAAVTVASGREETLGGWLAELFSPSTRAANEMLRSPLPKSNVVPFMPAYSINPRDRT